MSKREKKEKDVKTNDRIQRYIIFAISLTLVFLVIGVLGFYLYDEKSWIGAIYETTAIMSTVGAANDPSTDNGKIFASFFTMAVGLGYIFFISFVVNLLSIN